jgi:uncharacterized protein (TIGR03000 family)
MKKLVFNAFAFMLGVLLLTDGSAYARGGNGGGHSGRASQSSSYPVRTLNQTRHVGNFNRDWVGNSSRLNGIGTVGLPDTLNKGVFFTNKRPGKGKTGTPGKGKTGTPGKGKKKKGGGSDGGDGGGDADIDVGGDGGADGGSDGGADGGAMNAGDDSGSAGADDSGSGSADDSGDAGYASPPSNASFIICVPDPNADVWFQNYKTQQKGLVRQYESDTLNPDQTYTFHLKARWIQNGQLVEAQRDVRARASQRVTIVFSPPPVPAPEDE